MKTISKSYDFKEVEADVTKRWDKIADKIKATTQYDPKKKIFSFLEGPPTANAPPGLHHVEMRVFKDVFCRFKYMQGFTVPRKGGWDCHGLPVEVQVEKKLKLESKKDVIKFGVDKFCKECRTDIFTFIKDWEQMTKRLAYSIDLDDPYRTLNNPYIESVWWSLKEIFKKKMLYEGHKVVPYCPRCETPLSSHEVALGYKDVRDETVTVILWDIENENRGYLAWTTTPWTLPANVCLAVNKDMEYAVVSSGGREYVLAKELVPKYFEEGNFKIVETLKGEYLLGKKYKPLFPYHENCFEIVHEDYVTTEEGTGIVHQAPFGEVDFESFKKYNLSFVINVKADGRFDDTVSDFKNMWVKDADPKIIEYLEQHGALFKAENYLHSYPFCWRCNTHLIYYPLVSWFIAVSKIRDKLVKLNKKIKWAPAHIQDGRFGKWLEGAKDWALSRFKFWGTPLPIWQCECGEKICVGSLEELDKLRIKTDEFPKKLSLENFDLHKSNVDKIKFKCPKCSDEMKRVGDVIDCWYDSGAATFAQYHYPFENKDMFKKSFPYGYIAEAIDQTRGWFYTLHVLGAILFDDIAYKRCYVGGLLCDDRGEKMSKSKGNILLPGDMFDQYGVDAVRLLMCMYPFGENIRFGEKPFKESVNPFFRILWNSFYYATEFMSAHGYSSAPSKPKRLDVVDRWILSRVNSLVTEVENGFEDGKFNHGLQSINYFVEEEFSRSYIKLIRSRAQSKDDALAYVFYYVFKRVLKLLAPFAPYMTDELYPHLFKSESVHFERWPAADGAMVDKDLEEDMAVIMNLVSVMLSGREKTQMGVRWPLKEAIVVTQDKKVVKSVESLMDIIKSQVNVKTISIVSDIPDIKESVNVDFSKLGPAFGKESPKVAAQLQKEKPETILDHIKKKGQFDLKIDKKVFAILKDHLIVKKETPDHLVDGEFKGGDVYLDKTRTPELDSEGFAREVMRRVQDARKKAGLQKADRVILHVQAEENLYKMVKQHEDAIKEKCGADKIAITVEKPPKRYDFCSNEKVKGKKFTVCFEKK